MHVNANVYEKYVTALDDLISKNSDSLGHLSGLSKELVQQFS